MSDIGDREREREENRREGKSGFKRMSYDTLRMSQLMKRSE